jgi:hypothetical protein
VGRVQLRLDSQLDGVTAGSAGGPHHRAPVLLRRRLVEVGR